MQNHGGNRSRRQVGLAVGGLAAGGAAVFAWLTHHEAKEYTQAIENLKTNQLHLMDLVQNLTFILDLTDGIIKRNIQQIEREYEILRNNIQGLADAEERGGSGWLLQNATLQYTIMIENHADVQNRIIEATMTVHNGHLRPVLLPPGQVNIIRGHIGPKLELPRTIAQIYRMAEVRTRLTDDKLIFRVSIPILKVAVFKIWRVIPTPQILNGELM